MYAVVGCNNCSMLWLVSDPTSSTTAQCPRCGKTHQTKKLNRFFESDDRTAAQQARSALLAKKQGDSEAFADVDHVADLEAQTDEPVVEDREYLEASGVDADAAAAAGDTSAGGSKSRDEIIREAVREAGGKDRPTEAEIVSYTEQRGVPAEKAAELLIKLCRQGEASESGGRYRLL
ncbi:hypothetical protein halTADL_0493 [Halohasta litchfieldiae]|jgi:DNA-directed RNA polymerase subunit M/transcription elongation factor TFIIS|uniref:Uncharacterized protein n=1 Tax=Halohasta litchfieldiae TaxID=1073996 RepID=A0A1H6Y4K4_9EURY|nr:DUF5817 domain-containing protein [Halohasta litchfieldiae]ATW87306.1 hypothetical protein halTADL_0493 [Halohasta litchfieldiae]SEJ34814.1 hypothetical protein SAMN05444271_1533 [Halohasta litchfieldiae]